jgi:hypothetical protein
MDRFDDGIRCSCQETIDQMRARNGFRLGASVSLEFGPDASERERRTILIEGEPHDVLLFGVGVRLGRVFREAVRRDQTAVLWLEPSPPVRRRRVPDVGDWVSASTRRRWHSPAHHHNLTLTGCVAHDRRWIIREYAGHGRQISDILVHHPEQRDDRRLVRGDRIEIAHEVLHRSQG